MALEGNNEGVSTYSRRSLKGRIRECLLTVDGPRTEESESVDLQQLALKKGLKECPLTTDGP